MDFSHVLSVATAALAAVVAFFLKDLYSRHKKDSDDVSGMKSGFVVLGKLETSIEKLNAGIQDMKVTIASLSSAFLTRNEFSESNRRIHERLDALKDNIYSANIQKKKAE